MEQSENAITANSRFHRLWRLNKDSHTYGNNKRVKTETKRVVRVAKKEVDEMSGRR